MSKKGIVAGIVLALLVATAPSFANETIGAALISRTFTDGALGSIFALNSGFTQSGTLSSWSFFNNNVGDNGKVITPLLLDIEGGDYIIKGVGTSRTNDGTGIQSFSFGLTNGSDAVGPGILFGWKDGSNANPGQSGVPEGDFVGSPSSGTQQFLGSGHSGDLSAGTDLASGVLVGAGFAQPDRDYSIQATTIAATAPEPGTIAFLLSMAIPGAALLPRRRK